MGPRFAKVDINLDSHPKIRKAGRDGREVFLFVLRKNASLDRDGRIPASYVDPAYLAEQLMITTSEAVSGLSRCVTADLLFVTPLEVEISGWDKEWGGRPATDAERKAKQRNKARKPVASVESALEVTKSHDAVRDCHGCHAIEESREEESREDPVVTGPPPPVTRQTQIAELAIAEINQLSGSRYSPTAKGTLKNAKALAKAKRTDDEILLVIRSKTEWIGDGKMHQHFCPDTLLGPENFDRYLDQARGASPVRAGPRRLLMSSTSDEPDLSYDPNNS